jgi:hypothetical protein
MTRTYKNGDRVVLGSARALRHAGIPAHEARRLAGKVVTVVDDRDQDCLGVRSQYAQTAPWWVGPEELRDPGPRVQIDEAPRDDQHRAAGYDTLIGAMQVFMQDRRRVLPGAPFIWDELQAYVKYLEATLDENGLRDAYGEGYTGGQW